MTVKSMLHQTLNQAIAPFGLAIVRSWGDRNWLKRLKQAKKNGLAPRTILDGGAFHGLWSQQAARLFPGAQLVLIEPNPHSRAMIEKNIAGIEPYPILMQSALGASDGTASFNIWGNVDNQSSASLLDHVAGPATQVVEVQVETLDSIAHKLSMFPDLIKLDLQGGELDALRGGEAVLRHAEFAILEFGCLDAYVGRTNPSELLDMMYDHDYCLYDVVDLSDRPYDGALAGGDFFFVKNSSVLRKYKGWK